MNEIKDFDNLTEVATEFRYQFTREGKKQKDLVLFYAFNGTGKTRLSMEFKDIAKQNGGADTLYFNAFTEDLFTWDNDLEGDEQRVLLLNKDSEFFGSKDVSNSDGKRLIEILDIDNKIRPLLHKYTDFNFITDFNYIKPGEENSENPEKHWAVRFIREDFVDGVAQNIENIKISRGEENLFIWCFFLAIYELAIDKASGYDWVKYVYIDDPISSLDENNAIALACELASIIRKDGNDIKTVISTHHSLFFNIMFNELRIKRKTCFLHSNNTNTYSIQDTGDTPFFHHIALLNDLKKVSESDVIHTYHFNGLRTVMEKTVSFFGYTKIDEVIHGLDDEVLFHRAVQLLSHGRYSVFAPSPMTNDNKELFKNILDGFIGKYEFQFPEIFNAENQTA
ncbi:AAA family ATPase [Tenacibaculum soleae]|uniref:AAA family ATPase n=1 Tax=Tenacibaculum soleae TaxID=447689 RepID=UPI0023017591|nr:AAA family ATPase [Tenacibaculum soleae]